MKFVVSICIIASFCAASFASPVHKKVPVRYMSRVDVIFPGTKWCGDGNRAENYDDLGMAEETDKCCREHDHCDDFMLSGETKYNLTNDASFTRSHCDCDDTFLQCLQHVNTVTSDTIGNIFFTVWHSKCYKEECPIVECVDTALNGQCQEYILDCSRPKIYQFFDSKVYSDKE